MTGVQTCALPICCASVTMAPILARIPSVRKSLEQRSTPAMDGMSPPSNRTGFRRDTTTTAHRPGSRQSNASGMPRDLRKIASPFRLRFPFACLANKRRKVAIRPGFANLAFRQRRLEAANDVFGGRFGGSRTTRIRNRDAWLHKSFPARLERAKVEGTFSLS